MGDGAPVGSARIPVDLETAGEFARRLERSSSGVPFTVTMFGSRARGDADEESDLDLFVEVGAERTPEGFKEAARGISAELTLETGILVSAFLADLEFIRTHRGWSLVEVVAEEGVRV